MDSADRKKLRQISTDVAPVGERWKHLAGVIIEKRAANQTSLRFSEKLREKYDLAGAVGNRVGAGMQRAQSKLGRFSDVAVGMRPLHSEPSLEHLRPYAQSDRPAGIDRSARSTPQQAFSPARERFAPKLAGMERARTDPVSGQIQTAIERSKHFKLDPRLQAFLAGILNMRIPAVKIYVNREADAIARKFNADALAHEDNILFRAGAYDPRGKAGIALLAHELTHAALARMQDQRMPTQGMLYGSEAEERQALKNEKKTLHYLSSPQIYREPQALSSPGRISHDLGTGQSRQARTASPKAASTSRDLTLPPETGSNAGAAPQLSDRQLNVIKEEVYRDLMQRIRIEFERGG